MTSNKDMNDGDLSYAETNADLSVYLPPGSKLKTTGSNDSEEEMEALLEKKFDTFLKKKGLIEDKEEADDGPKPVTKSRAAFSLFAAKIKDDDSEVYDDDEDPLTMDTYSLLMVTRVRSGAWALGLFTFCIETILIMLHLSYLYQISEGTTPFDVPFRVLGAVRVGQFICLIISIASQQDVLTAMKNLILFSGMHKTGELDAWIKQIIMKFNSERNETSPLQGDQNFMDEEGRQAVDENEDASTDDAGGHNPNFHYVVHILIPNVLLFSKGMIVLFASFVIIVQSDDIIDLLKDFTALYFISELDDMLYFVARVGYLGSGLKQATERVEKVKVKDKVTELCCGIPLRSVALFLLAASMIGGWAALAIGQDSGRYFNLKYPDCTIPVERVRNVNDGICDGGILNSVECGFEGGDCLDFNLAYPLCSDYPDAYKVGDGECDPLYDIPECAYDGGDCCPFPDDDPKFSNGQCDGGIYNTKACGYDNGECEAFNLEYPTCPIEILSSRVDPDNIPIIGDGICQSGIYLIEDCFFEGEDCAQCTDIVDTNLVGNGVCNGGAYATEECGNDGGDCDRCVVPDMSLVGNKECNGGVYMSEDCSYDGLDCLDFVTKYPGCVVEDIKLIGNGICDEGVYATEACKFDGGDCVPDMCRWRDQCDAAGQFQSISGGTKRYKFEAVNGDEQSRVIDIELPFNFETDLFPGLSDNVVTVGCTTYISFRNGLKDLRINPMEALNENADDSGLNICNESGSADEGVLTTLENGDTSFLISFENIRSDRGRFANVQIELFKTGDIMFCYGVGDLDGYSFGAYILRQDSNSMYNIPNEPFSGNHAAKHWPSNKCFCFGCERNVTTSGQI